MCIRHEGQIGLFSERGNNVLYECTPSSYQVKTNAQGGHEHRALLNGSANDARVYPRELCKRIATGIVKQLEDDQAGRYLIANLDAATLESSLNKLKECRDSGAKLHGKVDEWAVYDITGEELDVREVKRQE